MAFQKRALFFRRLAEPHLVTRAVDILVLERSRGQANEFRGALEVGLRQVNEALLVAAVDAPALAGKAQGVHATRHAYST